MRRALPVLLGIVGLAVLLRFAIQADEAPGGARLFEVDLWLGGGARTTVVVPSGTNRFVLRRGPECSTNAR